MGPRSRQIPGMGGYARPRTVGDLTMVRLGRSESGCGVFVQPVVKKRILEGTK
jgi:hypothetical protein